MRAVVDEALLGQGGVRQLRLHELAEPPDHGEVQRAKVREEGLVDELMVDAEEMHLRNRKKTYYLL